MEIVKSYERLIKKVLLVCVVLFLIATFLYVSYSIFRILKGTTPDFSIFYYATQDILKNKNPYNDHTLYSLFPYPLITTFFYAPFTLLPYVYAQGVFTLISVFCIIISIYLSQKLLSQRSSLFSLLVIASLTFLSFPIKFTLGMGQINSIAYFFLLLFFYCFMSKKIYYTAIAFILAIILKPILGLFVLFFLLKKQFFIMSIIVFFISLLILLSLLLHGFEYNMYYVQKVIPHFFDLAERGVYYNQGFIGFISRITDHKDVLRILSGSFVLLHIIYIVYLYYKTKLPYGYFLAYLSVVLVMIDTLSWQHHFVFLLFPFIFLYYELASGKRKYLYLLLFLSYLLISHNIKNPQTFTSPLETILLSHGFFGAILLWIILNKMMFYKQRRNLFFSDHKKRIRKSR